MKPPKKWQRPLDEKRIGLLIRMNYVRACVCRKSVQEPLIRRGLVRKNDLGNYEITPSGKKFVADYLKKNTPSKLVTYSGITIGNAVMILDSKPVRSEGVTG